MFADGEIRFELTVDSKTGSASIKNLDGKLKEVEKSTKSMSKKLSDTFNTLGEDFSKLGSNITKYVTTPITALGVATGKTAIDFVKLKESTMVVFDRMLGGADASEELYQSLLKVAKASTYSQETFLTAGKSLVGMGISANSTVKYLQAITDAVSAFGGTSTDIEELSTVFGKMAMKGKVDLEDIWSLTDKGVNALKILANAYGVTTNGMQELISDGAVPATKALDILTEGMQNGSDGINGYVQGTKGMAQELKGGTLTGALDSLKSSFRNMSVEMWDAFENKDELINAINSIGSAMGELPSVMGPITSAVGPMLQGFADKLNAISTFAKEQPDLFEKLVSIILGFAKAGPILLLVGKGFKLISDLTKPIELFGITTSRISLLIKPFSLAFKGLFSVLKGGIKVIALVTKVAKGLITLLMANPVALIIVAIVAVIAILVILYNKCEGFRNVVNSVVSAVVGFVQNLWSKICAIGNSIVTFVSGIINKIVGFVQGIVSVISTIVSFIVGILAVPFDYVKNIVILVVALVAMAIEGIYNVVLAIVSWIYNNVLLPIYNFVVSVATLIYNVVSNFVNMVIGIVTTIATWIYNNVLVPIYNFFVSVFTWIYSIVSIFVTKVIGVFSTIASWIYNNVLSPIYNFFSDVFKKIWSVVSNVVSKIKSAFNTVASVVKSVFSNVKSFITNIFSTIAGIIKAPINGVINSINKVLKSMNKIKVPDWVPGLGGKNVNFKMIPTLNVGTNYVQHEGLAYLHEGEAVVPKKYNPAIGGYGNYQSPIYVTVNAEMDTNKFGQVFVNNIKTFAGGARSGYIQGASK